MRSAAGVRVPRPCVSPRGRAALARDGRSYGGDPAGGLAFAREAVDLAAAVHPRTRGWVAAVESEMYATTGDRAAWESAVGTAARLIEGPMPEQPWKGIGAFTPAKLTAYRGAGLVRLHLYADAQRVLAQALGQLDPVQAKHRATRPLTR